MGDWPLLGRDEEMDIVAGSIDRSADHAGVVIAGRAGVGKTRLAREAVRVAVRRGWVVRSAAGTAAAQQVPLGAFSAWIDPGGERQHAGVVAAVIAAITAGDDDAPVLLVVDDAHLLDELSAFVLAELVRRRLAVVVTTVRSGQATPETLTALWKDGHLRRLDLQPLSRPQSEELLRGALGGELGAETAHRLWELTRGNVLFLHALVRQELAADRLTDSAAGWQWNGELTASASLTDLIGLYIGSAPAAVLDVLDLVAAAEPLDLAHLTALADPAAIEEAERRELISVSDTSPSGTIQVAHPLYGEVRRANTGAVRAARLRGLIAKAMREPRSGVGEPDPARLAVLWLDSDLPGDAEVFTRGTLAAFQRLDLALTHRLADAAVAAGAGVEARLLLAQSLLRLGRADEAETAVELPGDHPHDFIWVFTKLLRASNLLFPRAKPEESWTVVEDALDAMQANPDPSLLGLRVVQLAMKAQPAEAVTSAESVDRHRLPALPAIILACGLTIAYGDLGRLESAREAAAVGNRIAADSPEAAYQAIALNIVLADALILAGCIEEARTLSEQLKQQWADIPGVPHSVATMINGLAALAHGDTATALANLSAAITEAEATESRTSRNGLSYLLWIAYTEALARAGQADAALDAQHRMQRSRHPTYVFTESALLHASAWVAAARGRTSEAIQLAERGAEFARAHHQNTREIRCLQAALQFGAKPDTARLAQLADLVGDPRSILVARWAQALAANDGDGLLEISGDLETMGDRIAAADAAAQAAVGFERQNRRGARLTAAGRVSRIMAECAATSPATRAVATPLPLSSREREIATLVAEGLSNRDIAETLTMSVRTVEGHIYRACTKLGAANRGELGRIVSEFAGSPAGA